MLLQRHNPFAHMPRIMYLRRPGAFPATNGPNGNRWAVPLDIVEEDGSFVVRASLPGLNPDDIQVSVEDGLLTIKGETAEEHERNEGGYLLRERRSGSFHRSLRLPDTVEPDQAEPIYENGVLTIAMPKIESKVKHLKINGEKAPEVEVAESR